MKTCFTAIVLSGVVALFALSAVQISPAARDEASLNRSSATLLAAARPHPIKPGNPKPI